MHYMSKVDLNARKRGARKLLLSPQAMHAAVEASFPPRATRTEARNLWRVDSYGPHNSLYVVSPSEPDFTHLIEQAGWDTGDRSPWETKRYDPFLAGLRNDQAWAFRLAANPTRQGRTKSGASKKLGHVTAAQQRDWLVARSETNGFSFLTTDGGELAAEVVGRQTLRFRRGRQGPPVTISQATYEGVLRITDSDKLRHALLNGIGRAKAYGCGLLTLAPFRGQQLQ